ncbi:hypothetical protein ACVWW5_007455 [Bradyrhizobium sp. LM3.4]
MIAITAFSSADTVRRFSIEVPNSRCKVRDVAPGNIGKEGHARIGNRMPFAAQDPNGFCI